MASPYFNTSHRLQQLTEVLADSYPDTATLTDEQVWQKLGMKGAPKYATLRNWYSDLLASLIHFLGVESVLSQEHQQELAAVGALRYRKQPEHAIKLLNKVQAMLSATTVRQDEFLRDSFAALHERSLLDTLYNPGVDRQILQQQLDVMVERVLAQLLRQYTLMLHEQYQHSELYTFHLRAEVQRFIADNPVFRKNAAIDILTTVLTLAENPTEATYLQLTGLIDQRLSELSFIDGYMAFTHASDHCMHQINVVGNRAYFRHAFEGFRAKIDAGLIGIPNILYPDFVYYVRMAAHCGDFAAARNFMAEFAVGIPDDVRTDVLQFCNGVLAQHEGNSAIALQHFSRVNLSQPTLKILVRVYTIENLLTLGHWDEALRATDALRHMRIDLTTVSRAHRNTIEHFVRLVPRVVRCSMNGVPAERRKVVLEAIRAMPSNHFDVRNWLADFIRV